MQGLLSFLRLLQEISWYRLKNLLWSFQEFLMEKGLDYVTTFCIQTEFLNVGVTWLWIYVNLSWLWTNFEIHKCKLESSCIFASFYYLLYVLYLVWHFGAHFCVKFFSALTPAYARESKLGKSVVRLFSSDENKCLSSWRYKAPMLLNGTLLLTRNTGHYIHQNIKYLYYKWLSVNWIRF